MQSDAFRQSDGLLPVSEIFDPSKLLSEFNLDLLTCGGHQRSKIFSTIAQLLHDYDASVIQHSIDVCSLLSRTCCR